MEGLLNDNIILLFFFSIIAVYNYSGLREYQRVSIVYITVYFLVLFGIIDIVLAMLFIFLSLFCFFEILCNDDMKFKILVNPFYKIIDCLYLSFAQYALLYILLSILLLVFSLDFIPNIVFKFISIFCLIKGITVTLQQKYVVSTFREMYKIFSDFPIQKINYNKKLKDACTILVNIEDRKYFDRKGYTFFSFNYILSVLRDKIRFSNSKIKICKVYKSGINFIGNIINEERGYSTIPMQLIRSLGIKRGYNYKYRRKIFELLYSKMFFSGVEKMLEEDKVSKRENIKSYYLYIYFHKVNTFLGEASFSKFLNAFDMQYKNKNRKDIYECSNEGIFIACMGLSKRALRINENTIDYYMNFIDYSVTLDRDKILKMVNVMMDKPFNGNYLS